MSDVRQGVVSDVRKIPLTMMLQIMEGVDGRRSIN